MVNVERIPGIEPHCETVYPNHNCYYIGKGCTGCRTKNSLRVLDIKEIVKYMKRIQVEISAKKGVDKNGIL